MIITYKHMGIVTGGFSLLLIVYLFIGASLDEEEIPLEQSLMFDFKYLAPENNALYGYMTLGGFSSREEQEIQKSFSYNIYEDDIYVRIKSSEKRFQERQGQDYREYYKKNEKKLSQVKDILKKYKSLQWVDLPITAWGVRSSFYKATLLLLLEVEYSLKEKDNEAILSSYSNLFAHINMLGNGRTLFFVENARVVFNALEAHRNLLNEELERYVVEQIFKLNSQSFFKKIVKEYYQNELYQKKEFTLIYHGGLAWSRSFLTGKLEGYFGRRDYKLMFYSDVLDLVDGVIIRFSNFALNNIPLYHSFSYHKNSFNNTLRERCKRYYDNGPEELYSLKNYNGSARAIRVREVFFPNWGSNISENFWEPERLLLNYVKGVRKLSDIYSNKYISNFEKSY